ncbi:hypothetical protein BGZ49_003512 [Haplosporangium sp. Z 27]|nr:hypothetical protein BGZ49_003512 [Haplosporangium sp. Z 27]
MSIMRKRTPPSDDQIPEGDDLEDDDAPEGDDEPEDDEPEGDDAPESGDKPKKIMERKLSGKRKIITEGECSRADHATKK